METFFSKRPVLIPGGAGFIGSNLAVRLSALGARVTVVDSFEKTGGANIFNLSSIDEKITVVRSKLEDFLIDHRVPDDSVVFFCVGMTDHYIGFDQPRRDYEINCASALSLLCKLVREKNRCRIVSLGSRSQYGPGGPGIKETDPLNPMDIQSVHKTALESFHKVYARRGHFSFAFLRLTNTYGPRQRMKGSGTGLLAELVRSAMDENQVTIFGGPERIKDLVFVDDVVEALILAAITETANEVFNIGGYPVTMGDLAGTLAKYIPDTRIKMKPFPEHVKAMDTGDATLDFRKFSDLTGWRPKTSLEGGIAKTIDYFRKFKEYYW